jgi:hypothetical protein
MAVTISKRLLSGSTDGLGIGITATKGATYNVIHTGASGATGTIDEVWLYAHNNFSEALNIVLEIGASSTANAMSIEIQPFEGPQLILPGFLLMASATAANDIQAYINNTQSLATSGSTPVAVWGYVNRIVQS